MMNIILFVIENWRRTLVCLILFICFIYYGYSTYRIKSLINDLKTAQQTTQEEKNKYNALAMEFTLTTKTIESLNAQLSVIQENHNNAQIEIANYKDQLNRSNTITKQWMRMALGLKQQMSSVPNSTSTINAKDDTTGLVVPSDTAAGINDYINACQELKAKNDSLIDFNTNASANYNKLIN